MWLLIMISLAARNLPRKKSKDGVPSVSAPAKPIAVGEFRSFFFGWHELAGVEISCFRL